MGKKDKHKVTDVDLDRRAAEIRAMFGTSPQPGKWRPAKSFDEPYCHSCGLPYNNCCCGDNEDEDRPY